MSTLSQRLAIGKYLKSGKSLTPLDDLHKFGTLRLSGRIFELKHLDGITIGKIMVECGGKTVAKYFHVAD